ncbi:hypothetical protein NDU88_006411 [Pleurodeles waltl]|uniref:Uncharacterized protein n=1 Tax=Pleurodeles waltl TaxID=8319 RepID=A0AAV7VRB4_PLEWA|nr:hypothetical protein NDU88_006411 [Pleurodeles waltl]
MSQYGDASAGAAFDLGKLESYAVAQLRQFCKNIACPIKGSTRKDELQKTLRSWMTAKEAEGHTEGKDEDEEPKVHGLREKSLQWAAEEEKRENKGGVRRFLGPHTVMHRLVSTQGRLCIDFWHSVMDPLRVVGFSDAPESVRGILGLWSEVKSAASFRFGVQ